ncbi:MAG: glycoside hydrolase family 13 protein [Lachnospiraceae bacterium]|nr:glycoside hydrolase family 13 protein [Lachnospiraceae bacterium]
MNRDALFSDGTKYYQNPPEPKSGDTVTIRLRTAKGEDCVVVLCTGDERIPFSREVESTDPYFDYFKGDLQLEEDNVSYYFEIRTMEETIYYDRFGASDEVRWQYRFTIAPDFSTPDWSKGAVMYQILVDRFADGDMGNDVEDHEYHYITSYSSRIRDWNALPANFDVCNFYGGDLEGVRQKLFYLKGLGIEAIYFNPLFVSPSNHKYDIQDYDHIDPHYGVIKVDGGECLADGDYDNHHATMYKKRVTALENLEASNEFFANFVKEAHEKGIRVILDGVFNHCGSFNKWLDREGIYDGEEGYDPGAYVSKDSPYHDFFRFFSSGEGDWPYNNSYDGWWGHDTLPKLNYEGSQKLEDYIIGIGRKWVSPPYNCDGWRLDVAADLGHSQEYNHKFWKRFRREVKEANPQAIVLAEHYGDASSWLAGDQWDTVMNYDAFMEPVSFFLTGMEKHSDRYEGELFGNGRTFEITMRHCMTEFLSPSLYCAMNQLSNHDHSRFLTRTNHKVGRVSDLGSEAAGEDINIPVFKLAVLIQMTWPGAPTLYYGDEAGVVGFTDPDNRRTYPWGNVNEQLIDYHRDAIFMHRYHKALKLGSLIFLSTGRNFVSYGRFTRDEKMIIAINSGDYEMDVTIPVWKAEVPADCQITEVFKTSERGYSIMQLSTDVKGGYLQAHLDPYTGIVWKKDL